MNAAWSERGFDAIAQLVAARTGIDLRSRKDDAECAMRRTMAKLSVAGVDEFVGRLSPDSRDWDALIEEITIRETYFYRHPGHFALVRERALPELRKRRGAGLLLRAWSAGCASGEEAYSLAMCLQEEGLLNPGTVHGTDVCQVALTAARAGRYREWSLRGLDPALSQRYLRSDGAATWVCDELRNKLTWSQLNLADDSYPSTLTGICEMDLIFCRNVFIYFGRDASRQVERRLFESLAEGGWLFTGPCDPVLGGEIPFQVITTEHGLVYRKPVSHEARAAHGAAAWNERARFEAAAEPALRERAVTPAVSGEPGHSMAARAAVASGDEKLATQDVASAAAAAAVRATWNASGSSAGMAACQAALALHPLSAELQYLQALTLMDLGWDAESVLAVRRCLYLDRSLLIAHYTLGALLHRLRDPEGARRAYRNVLAHCPSQPPDDVVALGDGVTVAILERASARALGQLPECTT